MKERATSLPRRGSLGARYLGHRGVRILQSKASARSRDLAGRTSSGRCRRAFGPAPRTGAFIHAVALVSMCLASCGLWRKPRPNILFLVIDSLRADHVGFSGYDRPTSPCLDSLAAEGVAFTHCTAQAPYTQASLPSLLTGRYPTAAYHDTSVSIPGKGGRYGAGVLVEGVASIAAMLRSHGYSCAAISASVLVKYRIVGLEEQFDYLDASVARADGDCAGRINRLAIQWLSQQPKHPWLCYIHYMDVHHPYAAPEEYSERFSKNYDKHPAPTLRWMQRCAREGGPSREELDHIVGMYDAEIAYVDAQIRRLLGKLRSSGLAQNLMVIVAADHGEEFYERGGFSHGQSLYEEQTRCPLILVWPGHIPSGSIVQSTVQNVDIVPTILDLLDREAESPLDGYSLVPWFNGEGAARPVFSEKRGYSVGRGRWKLWHDPKGEHRLYDLTTDPAETVNLASTEPETLRALRRILDEWKSGLVRPPPPRKEPTPIPMDSAAVEQLRALGYMQ